MDAVKIPGIHSQMVPFVAQEFGLPYAIQEIYATRGVTQLYKWQYQCLTDPQILGGCRNLIYSVPTGGGKSLVAEILLLRRLTLATMKKKTVQIMILPYISIVTEKVRALEVLCDALPGSRAEPYFGSHGPMPVPSGPILCVCTIEKANNIVNQMLEDDRLEELGLVVVDELHLIAAKGRGGILESTLVKIHSSNRISHSQAFIHHVQIVGMSATIPNYKDLVTWLDAKCYVSTERAVPLHEHIKIEGAPIILSKEFMKCAEAEEPPACNNSDFAASDLSFYISKDKSVSSLIFCPTRKSSQDLASKLAAYVRKTGQHVDKILDAKRQCTVEELQAVQNNDSELQTAVLQGVAFHHGGTYVNLSSDKNSFLPGLQSMLPDTMKSGASTGLTMDEREIVEKAFKSRLIQTLCATSTLAAGVNLPARRVILKGMTIGKDIIQSSTYRQMIGRAGRAGLDPYGETYLVVKKNQQELAMKLMNDPLENCQSSLLMDQSGLIRLCLDLICCKLASTDEQLELCLSRSFLAVHSTKELMQERKRMALEYLQGESFVGTKMGERCSELLPRCLGLATFKTSFTIGEALMVATHLRQAQNHLVLSDELHLVYLTAPITNLPDPDWEAYYRMFHQLSPSRLKVALAVGLSEGFLSHKGTNRGTRVVLYIAIGRFWSAAPSTEIELIARRFWCALLLLDAIHEMSLPSLATKYKTTSGNAQSLMKSASYFAHSTVGFCSRMGWWALELIISKYITRLGLGVGQEIIPLVELPHIGASRARILYNAGYKTAQAIASAKPQHLISCCRASLGPYPMHAASSIIKGAKTYLKKQANEMKQSADELLLAATTKPEPS